MASVLFSLLASSAFASDQPPPAGVPSDAHCINGAWFRIYRERGSWQHAKDACIRLGGQLAIIHDEATWLALKPLTGQAAFWLGASDEETEGVWKWLDGTPLDFTAWLQGEPTATEKENYLITLKGSWNDAAKNDKSAAGFVCQWKTQSRIEK